MVDFEKIEYIKDYNIVNDIFKVSNVDKIDLKELLQKRKHFCFKIEKMFYFCGVSDKTLYVYFGEGQGCINSVNILLDILSLTDLEYIICDTKRKGIVKMLKSIGFYIDRFDGLEYRLKRILKNG